MHNNLSCFYRSNLLLLVSIFYCISGYASPLENTPFSSRDVTWKTIEKAENNSGIEVDLGTIPNEPLEVFRGTATINASQLQIIAVTMDVDRFTEWVYGLKHIERDQHTNQPENIYMQFHGQWPVKARDVGVKGRIIHNQESGVIDLLSSDSGTSVYPNRKGHVRIPHLYNSWRLIPLEKQKTKIIFTTFVDIGGNVPSWLMNMVSKTAPTKTIQGIKKQLATGRYFIDSVEELPFVPKGLYLK